MTFRAGRSPLLVCTLLSLAVLPSAAQEARILQIGPAALPGIGIQAGYVQMRETHSLEVTLYADGHPSFDGGRSSVQLSGGIGAAFRPLGILRLIGNADYGWDIDMGMRFGPSLTFTTRATRADKNKQFSLFLDPFIRIGGALFRSRVVYLEVGALNPVLRAGLQVRL